MRRLAACLLLATLSTPVLAQNNRDYGDAPDSVNVCFGLAYPDIGAYGHFPTCGRTLVGKCGPGDEVVATESAIWLGPNRDVESGGNGGQCASALTFPQYDLDECYEASDVGLRTPQPYTIVYPGSLSCNLGYSLCGGSNGTPVGSACGMASWVIQVSGSLCGYLNILVDWTRDGDWCDVAYCFGSNVSEHALVNYPVCPGEIVTPPLPIGPNAGYVWARITVGFNPTPEEWDGGSPGNNPPLYQLGEIEDYLVLVTPASTSVAPMTWGSIKARYGESEKEK